MALRPVRLEPRFVRRIWGARNLAPLFPEKRSLDEPVGEVWLTGNDCRFAAGPFAGEKLGDVWPRWSGDWAGTGARHDRPFPVLVKFLFPEDKLSVQVHPDDDYALRYESAAGGVGKTEMWYVISARPGAEVRVGLKPEVSGQSFRRAIAAGNAEEMLERIPVSAGDSIFVPAGTVHTIGPGMILCEIQQNSDVTYRVYDFGRVDAQGNPRDLHIEKAFDVIRFGKQQGRPLVPKQHEQEPEEIVLADCAYFSVTKFVFANSRALKCGGQMVIVIVLEGHGILRTEPGGQRIEYAPAQAWLIPAALRDCLCEPRDRTMLLSVAVPEQA